MTPEQIKSARALLAHLEKKSESIYNLDLAVFLTRALDSLETTRAEVARLQQDRESVLLEACKAVCDGCYAMSKQNHITVEWDEVYQKFEHVYHYKIGTFEAFEGNEDCKANAIRKLLADQGQGQASEKGV